MAPVKKAARYIDITPIPFKNEYEKCMNARRSVIRHRFEAVVQWLECQLVTLAVEGSIPSSFAKFAVSSVGRAQA